VHNPIYLQEARKSVSWVCKHQNEDGSWPYSPLPFHRWIDNFHTGYNIECISEYQKYSGDTSFEINIKSGLDYYIRTFFLPGGMPKYYNNSIYPVDIHATAQLIITLFRLGRMDEYNNIIRRVLSWTIENMQSPKGFFYFQKYSRYTIKIPYIRWSQAWMFFAFTLYFIQHKNEYV
jgi:hypothetical protein